MVKLRKSLSAGHGVNAWLQQRITAVVMLLAALVLIAFVGFGSCAAVYGFSAWKSFFDCTLVKVISQILVIAVVIHAWIGMRDIVMDYIKSYSARVTLYMLIILWLLGSLIYSAAVLWTA